MRTGHDQAQGLLVSGRFPELEDALCERVQELRHGRPLTPLTVVVGSAHVRTRVGDLLVRRLGALANVSVVTLGRLAADLVATRREAPQTALAGLARERLLRRLIAARELAYFAPVQDRPHFPQAVAATFADLREACVAGHSDWARAALGQGATAVTPAGTAKAADLQELYDAYCDELARLGLADGAQVLLEAASAVREAREGARAAPPAGATADDASGRSRVVLYGIYDLNQAQEALVAELLHAGADLFVPIPRGGSGAGASALEVACTAGLAEQRREAPAVAADLARLAELWRASPPVAGPTVSFLGDGTLTVASVPDQRAELREAARAVLAAAAAGAAFWDCAVVVPRSDDVERAAAALEAVGLPVACRRPDRSVGPRLLLRLADCLAPPAGAPFARRAVVDLLSASPLRDAEAAQRDIALWLDEARQAGVVSGLEQWQERSGRRRCGLERRLADLEARGGDLVADDDEGAQRLDVVRVRLAAARSLEAAVGALGRACDGLPSRAGWGAWAAAVAAVAAALFEAPSAAAVADAAGRLAALDVLDEEVDVAEMAAALREQLADARLPQGRVGREGVAVLTPLEIRGLRFHTVAFVGLAEGGFPSRGRPDPLLGDADRRRLAEALGVRLPLAEARDAESLLLFAFACEAAREQLTLLAPRTDAATGRPRLPSRLLLRLASLAAGHPVGLDEFLSGAPLAAVWRHVGGAPASSAAAAASSGGADVAPASRGGADAVWTDVREHDTAALLALSARSAGSAARVYLGAVLDEPGAAERRLGQWRSAREKAPGTWDGLLGDDARAALAARHPFDAEMSPTRLERYVGCPFAFLLREVFGLDAPEEPGESLEMDNRELGILAHRILQGAYGGALDAEPGLAETLHALAAAWQARCAEAELSGVTGAALSWEVRRAMLLEDLSESVRRDPVFRARGGRPADVEWRFGEAAGRPVALAVPGGRTIRFKGRLDRVDVTAVGARIVDYKTGKGTTEEKRLKDGLSVQLPVYQLAVRQAGDVDYGKIACLYRLVTRRGGFSELPLGGDEDTAGRRLRALVAEVVTLVDAGLFPRSTAGRCNNCDVGYACGVTAWTRTRKRGHELLEGLVGLQRHGPGEVSDDAGA
ncbi:MAG: PD-(D/E)XK nuclease family protein [Actinomycetes bacterium]